MQIMIGRHIAGLSKESSVEAGWKGHIESKAERLKRKAQDQTRRASIYSRVGVGKSHHRSWTHQCKGLVYCHV
jgi:hypothetical protein